MPNIEFFKIKERCQTLSEEDVAIGNVPITKPWQSTINEDVRGYNVLRIVDATAQASVDKIPCSFVAEFATQVELQAFKKADAVEEYYKAVENGIRKGEAAMVLTSCDCEVHEEWRANQRRLEQEMQQNQAVQNNDDNNDNV